MRKEGSQFKCDRCGKTVFFEGGGSFNETVGTIKWDLIHGNEFCDECSSIFHNWFKDFVEMKDSVEVHIEFAEIIAANHEKTYKNRRVLLEGE